MKNYKAIIFDFDGTFGDTYSGIFGSYDYVAKKYNLCEVTDELVYSSIGSSPVKVFQTKFGLSTDDAQQATILYRSWYAKNAIECVTLYPGIYELLQQLKTNCIATGIATLKLEEFAIKMVNNMGVSHLIDVNYGADSENKLDKEAIVNKVIKSLGIKPSEALLIGDSENDGIGAMKAGTDFLAVTYGFGFKNPQEALQYSPVFIASNVTEIQGFLLK